MLRDAVVFSVVFLVFFFACYYTDESETTDQQKVMISGDQVNLVIDPQETCGGQIDTNATEVVDPAKKPDDKKPDDKKPDDKKPEDKGNGTAAHKGVIAQEPTPPRGFRAFNNVRWTFCFNTEAENSFSKNSARPVHFSMSFKRQDVMDGWAMTSRNFTFSVIALNWNKQSDTKLEIPEGKRKKFLVSCPEGGLCSLDREFLTEARKSVKEIKSLTLEVSAPEFMQPVLGVPILVAQATNDKFVNFLGAVRLVFVAISAVVLFLFCTKLSYGKLSYPLHAWAHEQKWTAILLLAVIGFDNPFLAFEPEDRSLFLFLDAGLRVTFLMCYLLAVLSMTDHMSQLKRKSTWDFYMPKLVLMFCIWLVLVVSLYYAESNPTEAIRSPVVVAFVSIGLVGYLLWLFFLIATMIHKVSNAPESTSVHVSTRFKIVWTVNIVMLAAFAVAVYRINKWGTTEYLLGYVGFNFYVYVLASLFYPAATSMPYRPPVLPNPDAEVIVNDEFEVEGDY